MTKKAQSDTNVQDIKNAFKEQSEEVKKKYKEWVELNRVLWLETIKAFDEQTKAWLSMQFGYLDMMNNLMGSGPDLKGLTGSTINPFLGQLDVIKNMNRRAIEQRKMEAEKVIKTLQEQHKKSVQITVDAFDKYCDLITSV